MARLKVRARAVDMLGRQQIAGIPNAIHELFKNAHDAYARRVEIDYFRRNRVLIVRDDGYGMTRQDVENRWLTLGTESRLNSNSAPDDTDLAHWRVAMDLPKRSIMGEKGIGRLAIAVVAPITLLLTRAVRPGGNHKIVVALVHWGLFEQPGLDISAIDVPIEEFSDGCLPSRADVDQLAEKVKENIESLRSQLSSAAYQQLNSDLDQVRVLSPDVLDRALNKPVPNETDKTPLSIAGAGHGTTFIVIPVVPELDDDIDGGNEKESSKLERNLLGFSNVMAAKEPAIRTEFRDHIDGEVYERVGSRSFFTHEDFDLTDQCFEGSFNELGQFVGTVSIYGKARDYVCNWTDGKGRQTRCGPFSFKYGYVQGRSNESRLSPEDWAEMSAKTERVGGLYIYRDGIRVLPYGNSDVDWLDIEKRRTYSASDWFFSYRRGFGYIELQHGANEGLTEKAGREGFRENLAYRDFRSVLVGFFKQLAYEFFRNSSPQGDDYNEGKEALVVQAELLKRQKAKADGRRAEFQKKLDEFYEAYNSGYFESESSDIRSFVNDEIDGLSAADTPEEFVRRHRALQLGVRSRIRALSNRAHIAQPRGLSLTKRLQKDWNTYEAVAAQLRRETVEATRQEVELNLSRAIGGRISSDELSTEALQDLERIKEEAGRELSALRNEAAAAGALAQQALKDAMHQDYSSLRTRLEQLVNDYAEGSAASPGDSDALRARTESEIVAIKSNHAAFFESLKRQMLDLAEAINGRETLDDRMAALESRNQVLEEQLEFYSDFAQMGMSVSILQHEFESAARGIRASMSELKPWADRNPPLGGIYTRLRGHIEHLDGYLKALDPLGRRLHRSTVDISGGEILTVLRNVFDSQLRSSLIDFEVTPAFRSFKIKCKSSALIGAFINVCDNAIYWLNSRASAEKLITLDADDGGFLISNNGPKIEKRVQERIFDFGETLKPGGRGLGLSVSKEALRREGLNISLEQSREDAGPTFKIFVDKSGS